MAAAAPARTSSKGRGGREFERDFSAARLKAPFELRCAAGLADYLVLMVLPVGWLFLERLLTEGSSSGIGNTTWFFAIMLFLGNVVLLPLLGGRTLGKMLMGLTIVRTDGSPVALGNSLRRHLLGYPLTVLTFGLGFIGAALHPAGRALHDLVGGTVVIKGRRTRI